MVVLDPLKQVGLHSIMNISRGDPQIKIGIIDGPVNLNHPLLQGSRIRTVNRLRQVIAKLLVVSHVCMEHLFLECSQRERTKGIWYLS